MASPIRAGELSPVRDARCRTVTDELDKFDPQGQIPGGTQSAASEAGTEIGKCSGNENLSLAATI